MKKVTFTTIAASALAALTIGLAAPAVAAPSGPGGGQDTVQDVQDKNHSKGDQTPYGSYQNDHKRHGAR